MERAGSQTGLQDAKGRHSTGGSRWPSADLQQPLPLDLITRIVHFRVAEEQQQAAAREKGRR
ncbi:hypothetical protein HNQ81_001248 [Desulfoprunum benzoelyticum]|uniref:Uncharacterized protein n=1 Tax=Desulfoprunum benzoelyticum TaxID=1506996 RepID=A0A840UMN0_9BACT|nr:hypothetical protein [Desulfoprunum benzoelyticum]MBB5347527.1 hypothetical protein [Desulfoprunum benzoelyticum]